MKILINYYSQTGNNKKVAEALQEKLECDIEEIKDQNPGAGAPRLGNIFRAVFKRPGQIQEMKSNFSDYDLVILLSPVWVRSVIPAVRNYIGKYKEKIKDYAILSISGSGNNKKTMKLLEEIFEKKARHIQEIHESKVKKKDQFQDLIEEFVRKILI